MMNLEKDFRTTSNVDTKDQEVHKLVAPKYLGARASDSKSRRICLHLFSSMSQRVNMSESPWITENN